MYFELSSAISKSFEGNFGWNAPLMVIYIMYFLVLVEFPRWLPPQNIV
jgi:hypothetical protein